MTAHLLTILATDCGSTTSKARIFKRVGGEYRYVASGEAPTTVEAPYEDVTRGVQNAVREIEELIGHKLLGKNGIIHPSQGKSKGVDIYVTTSSAGGGLQMAVSGLVKSMTAESAERAALGAGAIVMDVLALDDGRNEYEKIAAMRFLRPDMILFAGGTDGGETQKLVEMAQFLKTANPKARFGASYQVPVVYAGNVKAQKAVDRVIGENFAVKFVDNIRPVLEIENTEPARDAVHEQFMEHVMSHAPGYDKLMTWTPVPIMPTPAGEGAMFRTYAQMTAKNVIGVGLGGATTNIYSIFDGRFVRSVSANLGMSYSICNVFKEAGIDNIMRWIPFDISPENVLNRLRNKMIRPTTIPQTLRDLLIEHAVAREALRMGFTHHKSLARPLLGGRRASADITSLDKARQARDVTYIDLMRVHSVGGTGGLLSHAPRRVQSALLLSDGFTVEGITRLFQDSVFMMPHLGVLSTVHSKVAMEIFDKDCLVRLGTSIAFKGATSDLDTKVADVKITMPNGELLEETPSFGSIMRIPLSVGQKAEIDINPNRGFDIGAGSGRRLTTEVEGGEAGLIIDARGRPIYFPENVDDRHAKLLEWFNSLNAYPPI